MCDVEQKHTTNMQRMKEVKHNYILSNNVSLTGTRKCMNHTEEVWILIGGNEWLKPLCLSFLLSVKHDAGCQVIF